jgi:DNA-binding MarR family transcriptional regulator
MSNGNAEDKREAVLLGANLSSQLITTALALIAVVGAAATFIIEKKEVGPLFYCLLVLAFFLQVLSIYFGGRGVNKARVKGYDGDWSKAHGSQWYNLQASSTLLGAFVLCALFFLGKDKPAEEEKQLIELKETVANNTKAMEAMVEGFRIEREVDSANRQAILVHYTDSIKLLQRQIGELTKQHKGKKR